MNYQEANEILQGRNRLSKKIGNNTYLRRREDKEDWISLRYHETDVVTYTPIGNVLLNNGGWYTITTKERINWGLPTGYHLNQVKGRWYINDTPFANGMVIRAAGGFMFEGKGDPKADEALKKRVKAYAELCANAIPLDKPSGGDCWYCALVSNDKRTMGDISGDVSHLDSHIEEGYIVPSLVYNALQENYNAPMAFWQAFKGTGWDSDNLDFGKLAVKKAVYRYILKRKGFCL